MIVINFTTKIHCNSTEVPSRKLPLELLNETVVFLPYAKAAELRSSRSCMLAHLATKWTSKLEAKSPHLLIKNSGGNLTSRFFAWACACAIHERVKTFLAGTLFLETDYATRADLRQLLLESEAQNRRHLRVMNILREISRLQEQRFQHHLEICRLQLQQYQHQREISQLQELRFQHLREISRLRELRFQHLLNQHESRKLRVYFHPQHLRYIHQLTNRIAQRQRQIDQLTKHIAHFEHQIHRLNQQIGQSFHQLQQATQPQASDHHISAQHPAYRSPRALIPNRTNHGSSASARQANHSNQLQSQSNQLLLREDCGQQQLIFSSPPAAQASSSTSHSAMPSSIPHWRTSTPRQKQRSRRISLIVFKAEERDIGLLQNELYTWRPEKLIRFRRSQCQFERLFDTLDH